MHIVNQRFLAAIKATGWTVEDAFSAFVSEFDAIGVPYPNSFQNIYDQVQEHGVEVLYDHDDPMPMGLIDLFASVCKFSMEFVLFGRGKPDEETDVSTRSFDDFSEKSSVRAWVVLNSLSVSNAELAKVFNVSAGAVSQWRNQLCGMKPAQIDSLCSYAGVDRDWVKYGRLPDGDAGLQIVEMCRKLADQIKSDRDEAISKYDGQFFLLQSVYPSTL